MSFPNCFLLSRFKVKATMQYPSLTPSVQFLKKQLPWLVIMLLIFWIFPYPGYFNFALNPESSCISEGRTINILDVFVPRHVYGLFNCAVILNIHSKVIFREATFQSNTSKHTDWLAFLLTIMGEIIVLYGLESVFWPMKSFLVYIYSMTVEVMSHQLLLVLIKIAVCDIELICIFSTSFLFAPRNR